MRNKKGQFKKGHRSSRATEFKKGEHWRPHAVFRERAYLEREYLEKKRSMQDIANENGVGRTAIDFWLRKLGIPRRNVSEARKAKRWGSFGDKNPMYGKRGVQSAAWKGGCTPERQKFYASIEWRRVYRKVLKRDKGTCQRCGKTKRTDGVLIEVHHIAPFSVVELRAVLSNLVQLCVECHDWIHSKKNVEKEFLA